MENGTERERVGSLAPVLAALGAVGLILGGLLVGYEPVGGDPDRIFRPIKAELARSQREGRVPYWSDRLGLGVPLVAESHVAAFFPTDWLLYRALDVSNAYRLSMWLHHLALAAGTFAYARRVGVTPWGSATAAVSFPFCGFLTVHSSHEWAYRALAFLPFCMLAADHYAESGRFRWLAGLGLLWGMQITAGHFQVQMWTGVLALFTGSWRVIADGRPRRRLVGLAVGLGWGLAVAAVQLVPTWELAQLVGQTRRSFAELAFYSYPPAHWAEIAVPGLFRDLKGGPEAPYWFLQQTTGFEACLFIGTVPLILAFVGLVGGGRGLTPWRWVVPLSLALATMPRWWPIGYNAVLQVPGLGYFRCPARYTAVASFGLALLAGRGLDHAITLPRFRLGLSLAFLLGIAAFAWAWTFQKNDAALRASLDDGALVFRLGLAAASWAAAVVAILYWRCASTHAVRGALPFLLTALEVGAIYQGWGTTRWGWAVPLPRKSPVLSLLANEPGVRGVGGALDNLPVRAGLDTATPYTGFPLLPPHPLLKAVQDRRAATDPTALRWLRRYGVTHLVWDTPEADSVGKILFKGSDPALDRLAYRPAGLPARRPWRVIRLDGVFPEARVALRASQANDRKSLIDVLSRRDAQDEAWYLPGDMPREAITKAATSAKVVRWDGLSGEVEHDGACDLVLTRAYYPGWLVRVDDGPEIPASRADGGLLAARIEGEGRSRVRFRYRPNGQTEAVIVSLVATTLGLVVVGFPLLAKRRSRPVTSGG